MATPEKTKPQPTQRATSYMVLTRDGSGFWRELGLFDGVNAEQAQRNAGKVDNESETFVAVPARSWKPKTRKVEQVTKEIWS